MFKVIDFEHSCELPNCQLGFEVIGLDKDKGSSEKTSPLPTLQF